MSFNNKGGRVITNKKEKPTFKVGATIHSSIGDKSQGENYQEGLH